MCVTFTLDDMNMSGRTLDNIYDHYISPTRYILSQDFLPAHLSEPREPQPPLAPDPHEVAPRCRLAVQDPDQAGTAAQAATLKYEMTSVTGQVSMCCRPVDQVANRFDVKTSADLWRLCPVTM
jgi:hypothetical protein